jgi:hypothetical protein
MAGLNLPLTLKAGDSTQFTVTFAPQSTGTITGTINFISDATNHSFSLPLSDTAVSPGSLTPAPLSIGFGNVAIGTSQSTTETLTNPGGSNITISQVMPTGSGFSLSGLSTPLTLSPSQSASFTVAFSPRASGLTTGNISITSNGSNPAISISLSGSGISAGTVAANPTNLPFGTVQVGNSTSLSATLTNSGSVTVTISQANVSGSGFSVRGLSMPLTLTAGQSTPFSMRFAPTNGGSVTGNLSIISNASNPTLNIGLSGTAVTAGALSANPSTLSFGNIQTGSSKTLPTSISNSGGSSVTISQVTQSGAGYTVGGITTPVTLSAGQSCTLMSRLLQPQAAVRPGLFLLPPMLPIRRFPFHSAAPEPRRDP